MMEDPKLLIDAFNLNKEKITTEINRVLYWGSERYYCRRTLALPRYPISIHISESLSVKMVA